MYWPPELLWLSSATKDQGVWAQPADVWSVGILTYALVTGRAPFSDKSLDVLRSAAIRGDIYFPDELSDELKSFLQAALQQNPHDRADPIDLSQHEWLAMHTIGEPSERKPRSNSSYSIAATASLSSLDSLDSTEEEETEEIEAMEGAWYFG